MSKGRLEAFSDGVIAILITIMVLELKIPQGSDLLALRPMIPAFLAYVLSFVILGIYWNNGETASAPVPTALAAAVGRDVSGGAGSPHRIEIERRLK